MNLDSPDSVIFDRLMESMFREHPIRIPILGTRESIREITPEVLETCHRAFYTPANCFLCVVGDVKPEEVVTEVRQVLGDAPRPLGRKHPLPEEEMTCPTARTHCAMDIAMPTFCLGFKCAPVGLGEAAIRQEMAADLAAEALFGESSASTPPASGSAPTTLRSLIISCSRRYTGTSGRRRSWISWPGR